MGGEQDRVCAAHATPLRNDSLLASLHVLSLHDFSSCCIDLSVNLLRSGTEQRAASWHAAAACRQHSCGPDRGGLTLARPARHQLGPQNLTTMPTGGAGDPINVYTELEPVYGDGESVISMLVAIQLRPSPQAAAPRRSHRDRAAALRDDQGGVCGALWITASGLRPLTRRAGLLGCVQCRCRRCRPVAAERATCARGCTLLAQAAST